MAGMVLPGLMGIRLSAAAALCDLIHGAVPNDSWRFVRLPFFFVDAWFRFPRFHLAGSAENIFSEARQYSSSKSNLLGIPSAPMHY